MMQRLSSSLLMSLLVLFAVGPASSQDGQPAVSAVTAGLAEEIVEVKINYSGAKVVLFASAPLSASNDAGLVVALIGPRRPHTVTRNTPDGPEKFTFLSAPEVFAIGAEPHVAEGTSPQALIDAGLNAAASAIPPADLIDIPDLAYWRAAFVELKMEQELYSLDETTIERLDGGLRRAKMTLPPNAPTGEYQVRAVIFENGVPVGSTEKQLTLVRGGMDATLYDLASQHGLIYGFLAILLASIVGAIAAYLGRR